jgi:hypothetical protein
MNDHIIQNTTKLLSFIVSSTPSTVRTRTVINVIYILGIVFMIIVFLVLLWVNLYSRRCWCWHDTSLIHRFNRQWPSKHQRQQRSSNDNDELPF